MSKGIQKPSRIKRTLKRRGASEDVINYVVEKLNQQSEKIENLKKHCEVMNRIPLAVENRKLKIVPIDSSTSKITINPCDGRVELKVSIKSSEEVKKHYIELVNSVLNDSDLPPVTLRGKISYQPGRYTVLLSSESGRFSKNYEVKDGIQ